MIYERNFIGIIDYKVGIIDYTSVIHKDFNTASYHALVCNRLSRFHRSNALHWYNRLSRIVIDYQVSKNHFYTAIIDYIYDIIDYHCHKAVYIYIWYEKSKKRTFAILRNWYQWSVSKWTNTFESKFSTTKPKFAKHSMW